MTAWNADGPTGRDQGANQPGGEAKRTPAQRAQGPVVLPVHVPSWTTLTPIGAPSGLAWPCPLVAAIQTRGGHLAPAEQSDPSSKSLGGGPGALAGVEPEVRGGGSRGGSRRKGSKYSQSEREAERGTHTV